MLQVYCSRCRRNDQDAVKLTHRWRWSVGGRRTHLWQKTHLLKIWLIWDKYIFKRLAHVRQKHYKLGIKVTPKTQFNNSTIGIHISMILAMLLYKHRCCSMSILAMKCIKKCHNFVPGWQVARVPVRWCWDHDDKRLEIERQWRGNQKSRFKLDLAQPDAAKVNCHQVGAKC